MPQTIYNQLQERLDMYSVGFPKTETGIELRILETLFDEKDAIMFLALSPILETADSVAKRIQKPTDDVASQLEDMAKNGLVFCLKKGDTARYGAIPFIHGLFEFQVKRLDPEFAGMVEEYMHAGMKDAMAKSADFFLRTIPVQQSIDVKHQVATYEDAINILKGHETIVVTDCICRKAKALVDESCGKPLEACFMFGSMAQYYLDNDMGRQVDLEEAVDIMTKAKKAGLVTQPATAQNPAGMCNCCGDCCGVLRSLKTQPKPAQMVFSNYFATVDQDECVGCGVCVERCQMDAIALTDDQAHINLDRCIGCGLCVTECTTDAIRLHPKPEDQLRIPPPNSLEQMLGMAQKRGIRF